MTLQELEDRLTAIGLQLNDFEDYYITALYINHLEDMYIYFFREIGMDANSNINHNTYEFIKRALRRSEILKRLSDQLHKYARSAIAADAIAEGDLVALPENTLPDRFHNFVTGNQYLVYFQKKIFNGSKNDDSKLQDFQGIYQRTFTAFTQVTANYQNSIRLVCQRVIDDRQQIENVFLNNQRLKYLTDIEATNGDTHKGGLQVLILTFATENKGIFNRNSSREVKLVYKPRDIEIDSLICGQTNSLQQALPNYFQLPAQAETTTLFDYFNGQIQQRNLDLLPLTTYLFLPRNYTSPIVNNLTQANINNTYGYVEYLSYNENDDYMVNPQNDQRKIENFYQILGQMMAISVSFSLLDLHFENVRVHQYQPYLTDLENSLVNSCNSLAETGFTLSPNAINFSTLRSPDGACRLRNPINNNLINPAGYVQQIINGLNNMFDLIAASVNTPELNLWFQRMQNVLNRQIPLSTDCLDKIKRQIYGYKRCSWLIADIQNELDQYFGNQVELQAYQWWQFTANNNDINEMRLPKFFCCKQNYFTHEYELLDIPVYFHRLFSQDLLLVDGTVLQTNNDHYVTDNQVTEFNNKRGGVLHYFSYQNLLSPTQGIVIDSQLNSLINIQTRNNKKIAYRAELYAFLF